MKCNRKVFYYRKTSRSGKRKIFGWVRPDQFVQDVLDYWKENVGTDFDNQYEVCDGDVIGNVKAIDEPYYGGSSAELSVEFKCNKCGCSHYPELPTEYNFNEWLNKVLQEMS